MLIIIDEYKELLLKKSNIEQIMPSLPNGYISIKTIKEKKYYYLQSRVDGKIVSKYLKRGEDQKIKEQVDICKKYKSELPQIENRLAELEQAAKLINKSLYRELMLLKTTIGMDTLNSAQKEKSISFANAINAIEGIYISETTKQNIIKWKEGSKTFSSVFNETLNMYGFPREANNE